MQIRHLAPFANLPRLPLGLLYAKAAFGMQIQVHLDKIQINLDQIQMHLDQMQMLVL